MRQGGSIGGNAKKCRETCRHPLRHITRVIRPQRTIFEPSVVEFDCGHEGRSYGSHRGRCKRCPPRESEDDVSRKTYDDLQRLRHGLLVWGRELPSRWCGHGEDYSPAARYVVRRSNDTGLWSATAPDGTQLVSSARTAAVAKDACQRHHTDRIAGAGTPATSEGR
jgi:hypothetical protein